jgi:aminopeptidase N
MPGLNISKSEALERSEYLSVESYEVFLDITDKGDTFFARSTINFKCNKTGYSTFLDAVAERVVSATLNGSPVNTSGFDGETIYLSNLQSENVLVVEVETPYSKTGEGLQKSVDPVDSEVYLYSQGETAHIRKMYPCFDQPNLKATFNLSVLAPQHWEVISNNPVETIKPDGDSRLWQFTTTPRIPTYITAVVAGPYSHVHDEYVGQKVVPLAESLDPAEIFEVTKQGFAYFEETFGLAYPFEKYDQVAVVDFNWGAMENAGVVTFREDLLVFRSRVTERAREQRAHVILHEMAHMWFGNMVTMYWWDDLWLNESFAEWSSYLALVEGTRFKDGWTSFIIDGKSWAYNQDQLVTTHPIAVDMVDIEAVNANFDGISYAKGSSVLHQLSAYVGRDNFIKGLRQYFEKFAWKNTQLSDLLTELKSTSGRDLDAWSATWLKTAGINTMHPFLESVDGVYSRVAIKQDAPVVPAGSQEVRPHRIAAALYDLADGRLTVRKSTEFDTTELVGEKTADLFLINDGDLAYTKVRFDQRSVQTLTNHLGDISDPIARVLAWIATWDMWRDAEVSSHDFAHLVLQGLKTEPLINVVAGLGSHLVGTVEVFSDPARREELRLAVSTEVEKVLRSASAGSDIQLQLTRTFAAIAITPEQIEFLRSILAGGLNGLTIDRDLRWYLTIALAERGEVTPAEIAAVLATDQTLTGELSSAEAMAALPDPAIKAETWKSLINDELSTSMRSTLQKGFMKARQQEILATYVDPYFEALLKMWSNSSFEVASTSVEALYPRYVITQETLDKTDAWLNGIGSGTPEVLRRLVSEGRDSLARALRIQKRDTLGA